MIDPNKLFQLSPGQKRRKLALSFGALERDIAGIAEAGTEYHFSSMSRAEYENALCEILLKDPKLNPASAQKIRADFATSRGTRCLRFWEHFLPNGIW